MTFNHRDLKAPKLFCHINASLSNLVRRAGWLLFLILLLLTQQSITIAKCPDLKNTGQVPAKLQLKLKCVPDHEQFRDLKFHGASYLLKLKAVPTYDELRTIRHFNAQVKMVLSQIPSEADLKNLKFFNITPRFKLKSIPTNDEIRRLKYYGFDIETISVTQSKAGV